MTAANQLTSMQTATPTYKHQMNLNHKWLLSFPPVTLPPQTIRASKRPAPLETEEGIGAGLGFQCLRLQGLGYFFQFLLMVQRFKAMRAIGLLNFSGLTAMVASTVTVASPVRLRYRASQAAKFLRRLFVPATICCQIRHH